MQSSLMDQLHKQKFTSLLINVPSIVVQAHLHSCIGLATRAWLLVRLNTLSFCLSFVHFLITLCIHVDIPHPTVVHFSRCECGHAIYDLGIHLLHYLCESKCIVTHDTF
jgi:hypothetical protein